LRAANGTPKSGEEKAAESGRCSAVGLADFDVSLLSSGIVRLKNIDQISAAFLLAGLRAFRFAARNAISIE